MSISEWPVWARLAAIIAVCGTIGTAIGYGQTIAESDMQPFALKYQINAQFTSLHDGISAVRDQQTRAAYKALGKELNDLRLQRIQLRDMVSREKKPDEKSQKQLRLEQTDQAITLGEADYGRLRCQVDRDGC